MCWLMYNMGDIFDFNYFLGVKTGCTHEILTFLRRIGHRHPWTSNLHHLRSRNPWGRTCGRGSSCRKVLLHALCSWWSRGICCTFLYNAKNIWETKKCVFKFEVFLLKLKARSHPVVIRYNYNIINRPIDFFKYTSIEDYMFLLNETIWMNSLIQFIDVVKKYIVLTAFEAHFVPFKSTGNTFFSCVYGLAAFGAFGVFNWLERHVYLFIF